MSRNNSPRSKFLEKFDDHRLAAVVWDLMKLATTHDPDHAKVLADHARWLVQLGTQLGNRLDVVERRLEKLEARTTTYAVNDEQRAALDMLNASFTTLEATIKNFVPAGRRQSLALTHLETAGMYACKAIAKDQAMV